MANPKHRVSKTRRLQRRTHYKMVVPPMGKCDHCGEMKLPHRVCSHCGYYRGRQVLEVAEE